MINFADFEIDPQENELPLDYHNHPCNQSSAEHPKTEICDNHSTQRDLLAQEIDEDFEKIELSENYLDRMHNLENVLDQHSDLNLPDPNLVCYGEEDSQEANKVEKASKKIKNETKNIPKNFGKGVISFIEKSQSKVKRLLLSLNIEPKKFMERIKQQKKSINTIADLRQLWMDEKYGKALRIISNLFFRKYALHYIFNSRICNFSSHIKYRQSLWQAIKSPSHFNHIKQY